MADYQLIVSNPPHGTPDPVAVAPHLKRSAAEVRMKLNFPAPEIWIAETEKGAAGEIATALVEAGAKVAWIPGSVLAAAPLIAPASAIVIDAGRATITTSAGEMVINQGDRVVAALGEPVAQETRPVTDTRSVLTQKVPGRGPVKNLPFVSGIVAGVGGVAGYKAVDKLDKMAADARDSAETRLSSAQYAEPTELFLDVYAFGAGGWKATRLAPSNTDFSGLGDQKQPMARANIDAIANVLKGDFGARMDERLVKVTYKPTIVSGIALTQVLGEISEQLASVPLLDLGSRLVFLTSKD